MKTLKFNPTCHPNYINDLVKIETINDFREEPWTILDVIALFVLPNLCMSAFAYILFMLAMFHLVIPRVAIRYLSKGRSQKYRQLSSHMN